MCVKLMSFSLGSLADSLCRDDLLERNLYYTTFGTEEKRKGVDGFLVKRGR